MNIKTFFWINIPIFFILQGLDIYSTQIGLSLGFHEANPFMVYVVKHLWLAILVKFGVISLLLQQIYKKLSKPFYVYGVTAFHHISMIFVVGHNFHNILHKLAVL